MAEEMSATDVRQVFTSQDLRPNERFGVAHQSHQVIHLSAQGAGGAEKSNRPIYTTTLRRIIQKEVGVFETTGPHVGNVGQEARHQ